ncbi:MAG: Lrp/AsnC family transcriptional regulator [Lentisphaeria bacterium]|nr:Lrp/AsnC family transcriptional regulator [Lentisphaeria bacterium]MBQ7394187.1 Lrp/AsnC family transcriptional regulator [Lentisphaeria bacterium]
MEKKILRLLQDDCRLSAQEIAERIGAEEALVKDMIRKMEADQVILGYAAVVADDRLPDAKVRALIEVKVKPQRDGGFDEVARRIARFPEVVRLYLVSGGYDLLLEVEGDSLQTVAGFVSARLATIDGVLSTATSFQLKKYKESGKIMSQEDEYERLPVTP